ncbi:phosphotransferase [Roseovarius sp. CH_XMU1461]|uniref:phosphotransferase n=1 Tax=Roseovarius sp. CH_XMU1461 TaxID=3107777 RepID=UPI003008C322
MFPSPRFAAKRRAMTRITPDMAQAPFLPDTVHKRDIFSETISGELEGVPDFPVVLRKLDGVPAYARPIAWALARKEIRALKAVQGIEGCPVLVRADRTGLLRSWTRGTPLQLAKPADAAWYRDAKRLLREMRRAGVTHNDIAKPQNWLRTPEGRAAVIDFQLASVHRRRGQLFRVMAREDLRHLLKQKRAYAPDLLTPSEHRMLAQKALPARIWMATGKRAYNFITRRLMNWSDGEGTEDRIERDGPTLRRALLAHDQIRDLALATYALPAHGVGLYAFVETDLDATALAALTPEPRPELIQPVAALPRHGDGSPRMDALSLIAANRLDELAELTAADPALAETIAPIVAQRLNLTDRVLRR